MAGTTRPVPLRSRVSALLPTALRRPLRRTLDAAHAVGRSWRLRRALDELRVQARRGAVDQELVVRIREAWGNTSFSADASFVSLVASRVIAGPGPFLECGSGLTTVVAGTIAQELGWRVWSLEQDRAWFERMREHLARRGLLSVRLVLAPLREIDDFVWFDVRGLRLPSRLSCVWCDGPYVGRQEWPDPYFQNWRFGVVPVLQSLGIRFDELLLDDAEVRRCKGVRERWWTLGVASEVVRTPTGALVRAAAADVRQGPGLTDDRPPG